MRGYPASRAVPTNLPAEGTQTRAALERMANANYLVPADVADLAKWPAACLGKLHDSGLAHRIGRARFQITEAGRRLLKGTS